MGVRTSNNTHREERGNASDDVALAIRGQRGDMGAFGELVQKYQGRVFNLTLRMTNDRAVAEELAQEAFLKALEKIHQFRHDSRFYTWLFRIATNLVLSHRRRAGRIRFTSLTAGNDERRDHSVDLPQGREGNPLKQAILSETQRQVLEALEAMDEEYRVVLVLRDMQGMDYADVAEVIEAPVGTVKSRLFRARAAMREKLSSLMSEEGRHDRI
jgi:RNA polymerase sigma-70 factor (ECF subfamily)